MATTGLTILYTGNGKGKTTASLGMAFRALGHGKKVCVVQLMKSPDSGYGEIAMMNKLGIENYQAGAGCTWTVSAEETVTSVKTAWQLAKEKVMADGYDMVVLDELNIALNLPESVGEQVIEPGEVIELIDAMREKFTERHLVITGRYALPEIIEKADLVSEVNCIKHPFESGIVAQEGIEF